jgi:magnesium transporter
MRTDEKALEERLRTLAEAGDVTELRAFLDGVWPEDIAEALQRLQTEEEVHILQLLEPEAAANVLIELPTEDARAIVNQLPDATVATYLDILPMDDAIELREELDPERFEALLNVIPQEDALEIRRLLSYPDGSVGQIMTEDFAECLPEHSMYDILAMVRTAPEAEFETVNYIYVLSEDRHLLGLLSLRRVIRTEPERLAREVMHEDIVTVVATGGQEEAARTVARYGFGALPVLDERGRMVGILTADDAQEILQEAETEDVLLLGGVSGDAEAYLSLSVFQLVRRRIGWLLILFVAEFFTGSVLRHYTGQATQGGQTILAQMMLFVPLLIGAGGNAGAQVTTTITRALALGEVRPSDWVSVMRREIAIAFMIGGTLGFLGFVRAKAPIVGWDQPIYLSLVVGIALPLIVVWAAAVGSVLPITAKRLGFDPAVLSAPFITTFVDATGLIIYFEIARQVLGAYGYRF